MLRDSYSYIVFLLQKHHELCKMEGDSFACKRYSEVLGFKRDVEDFLEQIRICNDEIFKNECEIVDAIKVLIGDK